ncbi:hypothetical protein [Helicobacter labetoulli]|uniref:hypothetical protein n=1 Tax=Helicobacter labetoulli TaxID=2315333 RepID=UPI000EF705C8|nr:hypothetical protein [Helicobacter labetoulli]
MSEAQEFLEKTSRLWRLVYVNRVWLVVFGVMLGAGLYLGYLLFGNNSVEVLVRLKAQRNTLVNNSKMIEEQNANLQKQIFEIRGLKP